MRKTSRNIFLGYLGESLFHIFPRLHSNRRTAEKDRQLISLFKNIHDSAIALILMGEIKEHCDLE